MKNLSRHGIIEKVLKSQSYMGTQKIQMAYEVNFLNLKNQ